MAEQMIQNNESRLGKHADEQFRPETIQKNDYNFDNGKEYNGNHKDAISDGDPLGKGSGAGHGHSTPEFKKSNKMSYQLPTQNGGGQYDIEGRNDNGGRNFMQKISIYGPDNEYGKNSNQVDPTSSTGEFIRIKYTK